LCVYVVDYIKGMHIYTSTYVL